MKQHKSIKLEKSLIDRINTEASGDKRNFNNMVEVILDRYFYTKQNKCSHVWHEAICIKCNVKQL